MKTELNIFEKALLKNMQTKPQYAVFLQNIKIINDLEAGLLIKLIKEQQK